MKQLSQNKKIIAAISALLIVVGVIIALTMGFNMELKYRNTQKVEMEIGKEFEKSEVKDIANEILGQENIIQKLNAENDAVAIISKEMTDEQKEQLVNKINEKYELELQNENIEIINVPQIHLRDIIFKYISPFLIAGGIILAYLLVRYLKLGATKIIGTTIIGTIISQCLLFSVMAITRIPMGRLTIPMVIAVFVLTLYGLTIKFENDLSEIKDIDTKNS